MPIKNQQLNLPDDLYRAPMHGTKGAIRYQGGMTFRLVEDISKSEFIKGLLVLQTGIVEQYSECGRATILLDIEDAIKPEIQLFGSTELSKLGRREENVLSVDLSATTPYGKCRVTLSRWLSDIIRNKSPYYTNTDNLKHAIAA